MRHSTRRSTEFQHDPDQPVARRQLGDWYVIRDLLPYLLAYRYRVLLAISCLLAAKFANLGIPILLKTLMILCESIRNCAKKPTLQREQRHF